MTTRRLPDGTLTESALDYLAAWDALIEPVQAALKMVCIAYDPGVVLAKTFGERTYTLSVDMCKAIGEMAKGQTNE